MKLDNLERLVLLQAHPELWSAVTVQRCINAERAASVPGVAAAAAVAIPVDVVPPAVVEVLEAAPGAVDQVPQTAPDAPVAVVVTAVVDVV